MFREMRRHRQQLSEQNAVDVMKNNDTGILALTGDEGYPYAVPINFAFDEGTLYFHSAKSGHKIDAIRENAKASFTVVDQDEVVPADFSTLFRSVIAFGKVRLVDDQEEILKGLRLLVEKYSPEFMAEGERRIQHDLSNLVVIAMDIEHLSGKESKALVMQREKNNK